MSSDGERTDLQHRLIRILISDGRLANAPYVDVQNGREAERVPAELLAQYPATARRPRLHLAARAVATPASATGPTA